MLITDRRRSATTSATTSPCNVLVDREEELPSYCEFGRLVRAIRGLRYRCTCDAHAGPGQLRVCLLVSLSCAIPRDLVSPSVLELAEPMRCSGLYRSIGCTAQSVQRLYCSVCLIVRLSRTFFGIFIVPPVVSSLVPIGAQNRRGFFWRRFP